MVLATKKKKGENVRGVRWLKQVELVGKKKRELEAREEWGKEIWNDKWEIQTLFNDIEEKDDCFAEGS